MIQFRDIFSRASVEVLELVTGIAGSVVQLTASKVHLPGSPVSEEEHAAYDLMSRFSSMINLSSPPLR